MSLEFTNPYDELTLPDDIHGLIEHSLLPAHELNAAHADTEKYFVAGRPDLFVRLNRDRPIEDVNDALHSTSGLRERRINVLPFMLVGYEDQPFIITQRVSGHTLSDVLTPDSNQELIDQVDQTWEDLGENLYDSIMHGLPTIDDIVSPDQYMLGVTATNLQPKIWLTDLPASSYIPDNEEECANEAITFANAVIEIETLINQKLTKARAMAERIIASVNNKENRTRPHV